MTEIKLFNEWLETGDISSAGVTLWHALMYIASRSGWAREVNIPISTLTVRTRLSRSTIYREREALREHGLIEFEENGGRQSCTYRIVSFEARFASGFVSATRTQIGTQTASAGDENIAGSQDKGLKNNALPNGSDTPTDNGDLSKNEKNGHISLYIDKDIDKRGCGGKKEKRGKPQKSPQKQKPEFDLSFIGDPIWEELLRTWLEYKRSRSEGYKSDLSVKKFLTMLRNLSRDDPQIARQIIDKSIANNWAGIFELKDEGRSRGQPPDRPATGQRIGQIKQPEDEARRQNLLDKFGDKKA